MDPRQDAFIRARIQREFNVAVGYRKYYCEKLSYEALRNKLQEIHPSCPILFRTDHIVVKQANGDILIYFLVSHSSGLCANIHI